jgi:bacterioferritin-associated ferredoxin
MILITLLIITIMGTESTFERKKGIDFMWVCICHALSDTDIKTAETEGAQSAAEVFNHYGVKPQCGRCVPTVKSLMNCSKSCAGICGSKSEPAEARSADSNSQGENELKEVELDRVSNF